MCGLIVIYEKLAEATMVKYAVMTNCDLASVGNEFSRKPLALAVKQGSELKDQLSSAILKLLNQRKLESLKEKWWNKNPDRKTCDDNKKQSDGISINNIGGVFIVIFIGVVLACLTLAFEYFYYRYNSFTYQHFLSIYHILLFNITETEKMELKSSQ